MEKSIFFSLTVLIVDNKLIRIYPNLVVLAEERISVIASFY